MEEWKEYKLGEIASMKYGKLVPKNILSEGSIPIYSGYRYVGYTDKSNCSKDTIIVVARGVGGTGDVKITKEDCFLTNLSIAVNLDKDICIPYYFYYKYLLNNLKYLDSGSAQSQITIDDLKRLIVKLPNIETQCRIVKKVRVIDDKIEVNRRINEQLEELAQALFKSWFVDFEPFKGGEFVESELGMIPEGWRVGTLDEVSKLIAGGDKPDIVSPNKTEGTQYPIYSNGIDNYGLYGFSDNYRIEEESVTISARGTIGYVCLREEPYTPIVRLISVIPILEYVSAKFLYHSLRIKQILGTGTTQQQLTVPMFRKTLLVIPPKDIVDSFTVKVNSMFALRKKNQQEITHLTNLRDTLLPKLMSGEIDVNEVEI